MAYTALERSTIDVIAIHLADSHGCVLVRIHLNESEASVRLESRLDHEPKVLEQRNNVVRRRIGGQVSNIDRRLPAWCLRKNDFVTSDAMRRELVVAVRRSWGHPHGLHGLLLGHGGLALLISPIASNGSRPEPLSVHGTQSLLSLRSISEGDKAVASRSASFHIPHDASFGHGTEGRESLEEDLIVNLVGQVAHENVEVIGGILLARGVRLVGPVDPNFLYLALVLGHRRV